MTHLCDFGPTWPSSASFVPPLTQQARPARCASGTLEAEGRCKTDLEKLTVESAAREATVDVLGLMGGVNQINKVGQRRALRKQG